MILKNLFIDLFESLKNPRRSCDLVFGLPSCHGDKIIPITFAKLNNLGVFYTKNKEYGRAVAEFEKALELRPDDDYSHFNIGYIYAEYLVNRPKAVEHFRHFLRLTKSSDKDVDWVKKYILTWQSWAGKEPME